MENNSRKEQWVNEVFDSLSGMQQLKAGADFYQGVIQRIGNDVGSDKVRYGRTLFKTAIAAAVLLMLNITSIVHFLHTRTSSSNNVSVYQSVNDEINYLSQTNL